MARRKKAEEPENHERWLVSYADFITLLFAFFVVMYSISSVNEGKYRVLSETLESVFQSPKRSLDPIQVGEVSRGEGPRVAEPGKPDIPLSDIELPEVPDNKPPVPERMQSISELGQQLENVLSELIETDDVVINEGEDWLEIEIKSRILFASGEAELSGEAVPVIGRISDVLAQVANPLQIEGFTDNQPINTPRFPSNWELSAGRAASVVHLMDDFGIDPVRMAAIGYGQYRPIASNDTAEGRQRNRRVTLVVLGARDSRRSLDKFAPETLQQFDNGLGPIRPADSVAGEVN